MNNIIEKVKEEEDEDNEDLALEIESNAWVKFKSFLKSHL